MQQDLALLKQFIYAVHPLGEEEWNALSAIWQPVRFKRKTLLTAAGETERYLYFVTEGVQRAFHLDNDHPEVTLVFSYAPSFSGIVDSFLTQQPSRYFLETLTTSKMLRTTHQQLQQLMDQYHGIERWVRVSVSFVMMGLLERHVELLSYSAEEKFRILLKRSPHVLQLIPHKYLASYMGIDASTFSKLLSSVRIE